MDTRNKIEVTQTLIDFAWYSLTEHQRYRIEVKYNLQIALDERLPSESKRDIYRMIANKYNYTMSSIEYIALHKLNK